MAVKWNEHVPCLKPKIERCYGMVVTTTYIWLFECFKRAFTVKSIFNLFFGQVNYPIISTPICYRGKDAIRKEGYRNVHPLYIVEAFHL